MASKKYIKLGEKASFFYDPTTKITLSKGEVKELKLKDTYSKKIKKALTGGHIANATEEEFNQFEKHGAKVVTEEKSWLETFDPTNAAAVGKLTNEKLIELAIHLSDEEYEDDYFEGMQKKELIEEINEILNQ